MVTNVLELQNKLIGLGFNKDDIVSGSNQMTFNSGSNYPPNTQRKIDNDLNSNILKKGVKLDNTRNDVNLKRHLLSFNGRYERYDPISKRAIPNYSENYFIYLVGHGGDKYMKIRYLEIMFSRHFSDFFEELFISNKVSQAFVFSDTCSAGTLFYTVDKKARAFMIGSSGWDEYSTSDGSDEYIGQALRDKSSFVFFEMLQEMINTKKDYKMSDFIGRLKKASPELNPLNFNFLKKPRSKISMRQFLVPDQSYEELDLQAEVIKAKNLFGIN